LGFPGEAGEAVGIGEGIGENFDGDVAIEFGVSDGGQFFL
jgi:hypothetical protein